MDPVQEIDPEFFPGLTAQPWWGHLSLGWGFGTAEVSGFGSFFGGFKTLGLRVFTTLGLRVLGFGIEGFRTLGLRGLGP